MEVEGKGGVSEGEQGERGKEEGDMERENIHSTEIAVLELPSDAEASDSGGEEEEDGMIKPIIKFDKFPFDLSWDQI